MSKPKPPRGRIVKDMSGLGAGGGGFMVFAMLFTFFVLFGGC